MVYVVSRDISRVGFVEAEVTQHCMPKKKMLPIYSFPALETHQLQKTPAYNSIADQH